MDCFGESVICSHNDRFFILDLHKTNAKYLQIPLKFALKKFYYDRIANLFFEF